MALISKDVGGRPTFSTNERFDVSIPYVIPISAYLVQRNNKSVFLLPSEPEKLDYSVAPIHSTEYAINGDVIIRKGVNSSISVVVQGRTGSSPALHFKDRETQLSTPKDIIEGFESQILTAQSEVKSQAQSRLAESLDFYDLLNGRLLKQCVVSSFTYSRDVGSSRLGYEWELVLTCYTVRAYMSTFASTAWGDFLGAAEGAINLASVKMLEFNGVVEGTQEYALAPIRGVTTSLSRASTNLEKAVTNFAATPEKVRISLDSVRGVISDVLHSVAVSVDAVKGAWSEIKTLGGGDYWVETWGEWSDLDQLRRLFGDEPALTDVLNAVAEAQHDTEVAVGYSGHRPSGVEGLIRAEGGSFLDRDDAYDLMARDDFSTAEPPVSERFHEATLRMGDNLYTVAQRALGDASLWSELAEVNGWLDAHTDAQGQPASAGTRIRIPRDEGTPERYNPLLSQGGVLLTDILLSEDGDLLLNGDDSDVQLVHSEDNLIQAITNRLRTALGELPMQDDYGLESPIGQAVSDKAKDYMTLNIIDQLTLDDRIAQVNDVVIVFENQTAYVDLKVVPVEGESVNITLPLG